MMIIIDKGHKYVPDSFDGVEDQTITFMKREGDNYPGNVGKYSGTNIQEVLRILIDRIKYLDNQIPDLHNQTTLGLLRGAIFELEERAAMRHNRTLSFDFVSNSVNTIEDLLTCPICGHIECNKHADTNKL